jgi:hypothetical protein
VLRDDTERTLSTSKPGKATVGSSLSERDDDVSAVTSDGPLFKLRENSDGVPGGDFRASSSLSTTASSLAFARSSLILELAAFDFDDFLNGDRPRDEYVGMLLPPSCKAVAGVCGTTSDALDSAVVDSGAAGGGRSAGAVRAGGAILNQLIRWFYREDSVSKTTTVRLRE